MADDLRQLRGALLDLTGVLNRPQPDAAVISMAGVELERALFPLLARIERLGPIGVVELAELVGRDHTTVSRQMARLEALGLITRSQSQSDKRQRVASITAHGQRMTAELDKARQKVIQQLMADWSADDIALLSGLLRRLADDALCWVKTL